MNFKTSRVCRLLIVLISLIVLLSCFPAIFAEGRQEQLDRKIAQIISQMPTSANTDSKKALYLHDYIVQNVSYAAVGDHQTAFGALLDGKAVCTGYADAYLRLLTAAGIRAYTVTGIADNGDGEPASHAWTMLYLDGNCVFTDVTWDDPLVDGEERDDYISHTYFQLSLEQMSRDHFPDSNSKALLPASCNHTGYNYYSVMQGEGTGCGIFNDSTTAQHAAKYFRYLGKIDGKDTFFCDFQFDGTDMLGWMTRNWKDIASALGLGGSRKLSYLSSASDTKMTLSGTLRTDISVTSVSLTPDTLNLTAAGMTAQLNATVSPSNATNKSVTYTSSDPSVATVSSAGLVTARANGTTVITVKTKDGGKTASCKVTVSIPTQQPEPTETTAPIEPSETTKPTVNSEPTESTEPSVPTETVVTVPTVPTEPSAGNEPTDHTTPSTQPSQPSEPTQPSELTRPTEPKNSTPTTATAPSETQIQVPAETDGEADTTTQQTDMPAVPPVIDKGSSTVLKMVLFAGGGVLLSALLLFFVLKRR